MPWDSSDATSGTKKAKTPKLKRQWEHVANSVLKRTGDDKLAKIEANGVIKRMSRAK